jgi:hypothetical protein
VREAFSYFDCIFLREVFFKVRPVKIYASSPAVPGIFFPFALVLTRFNFVQKLQKLVLN